VCSSPCVSRQSPPANAEGTRFDHLAREGEQTSLRLQGWRIWAQGTGETLQPQALAENLQFPCFQLLSAQVVGQASLEHLRLSPFRLAPWPLRIWPVSGRSVRAFLPGCCRRRLTRSRTDRCRRRLNQRDHELRETVAPCYMNPPRLSNSLQTFKLLSATQCCLTLRSSGPPPARRLGREAVRHIIRFAAQAPCRWCPLSSNVRPARSLRGSCSGVSKQRAHGQQNASAACPLPAAARTIPTTISARFACG
jgi:hypothetical protein